MKGTEGLYYEPPVIYRDDLLKSSIKPYEFPESPVQLAIVDQPQQEKNNDFRNPTPDDPVEVSEFLGHTDLTQIMPEVMEYYAEDWRYRYPPKAMLKAAICFELSTCKFLSEFWRRFESNPEMAVNLGFEIDEYGNPKAPSYKTIWYFIKIRLGNEGMHEIVDATLKAVNREGSKKNVTIGEDGVGLDACPLEAVDSDRDATYNGHYKMKGYFWHNLICIKHNLPLNYHVTNLTEDEGHLLAPMLYRIRWLGIDFSDIYVDGGYASLENIARTHVLFGVDVHCNIAKNWKFRRDGLPGNLVNRYYRLPKRLQKANADLDDMLLALIMAGQPKPVGAYYRNSILAKYEECPDGYLDDYHLRNRVEGVHGVGKRKNKVKQIETRGIVRVSIHVGLHVLSKQIVALTRLQNGIVENLGDTAGLV